MCRRTSLLPVLCHQAADGERPHWLHHRRGTLFAQWGQAHQTTDWLQDSGKGFTCPRSKGLKETLNMLSGTRGEKRGGYGLSVMRWAPGHKVVVVTLDMKGAHEWRPPFLLRPELSRKRAGLRDRERGKRLCMCVCLHKQRDAEALSFWNLLFIPDVCLLLSSPPPWRLFQQGKLRRCLVLPSFFSSVTSICTFFVILWTVIGEKQKTLWRFASDWTFTTESSILFSPHPVSSVQTSRNYT